MKRVTAAVAFFALAGLGAQAAERVTLRNGFTVDCVRHEADGDRVRLFLRADGAQPASRGQEGEAADTAYMDVTATTIVSIATVPDPAPLPKEKKAGEPSRLATRAAALSKAGTAAAGGRGQSVAPLSAGEMHPLLAHAGEAHRIDEDLLASVVRAESGGQSHAVSRTGARGLMQLMPGTATAEGVADAFEPGQNVEGGAAYLDRLLTRYHDDMALALAAYNAGPGAVDRWHGVPPYRETRAYVARVIREFNRRKLLAAMVATRAPR